MFVSKTTKIEETPAKKQARAELRKQRLEKAKGKLADEEHAKQKIKAKSKTLAPKSAPTSPRSAHRDIAFKKREGGGGGEKHEKAIKEKAKDKDKDKEKKDKKGKDKGKKEKEEVLPLHNSDSDAIAINNHHNNTNKKKEEHSSSTNGLSVSPRSHNEDEDDEDTKYSSVVIHEDEVLEELRQDNDVTPPWKKGVLNTSENNIQTRAERSASVIVNDEIDLPPSHMLVSASTGLPFTYREPEQWEKNIVALDRGEWEDGMNPEAFKRWKAKERARIPSFSVGRS
jgi:hypothetical protein